ncbi:DUF2845 domain-containing protein [Pseudoalteromonas sp. T1lg76]|uniref:DUF2845 domain-containing protein n=1 Tax=Pseudoalteromonas sp. T1lg76 TaxID=2077103 RepID=UPI001319D035|nr:DUF2845 domain-containing protein [Pseudoalteromonas sp. T1lg76]
MKNVIYLLLIFCSAMALAGQSFRLADGDLVYTGMNKIEILDKLGEPLMKDVQSIGVDKGDGFAGKKTEIWSYRLRGDIGGEYLVSVTFKGDKVTSINSKQRNR